MDLFHDAEDAVMRASEADVASLHEAGSRLVRRATVVRHPEHDRVELDVRRRRGRVDLRQPEARALTVAEVFER